MNDSEIIGSQKYANVHLFEQWCLNFFDISKQIEAESQMDSHDCRWFFIAFWELFTSGERYVRANLKEPYNTNCEYLKASIDYILKLKALYDDTDYFMLQYYRHSSAHIFQSEYSLVDKTNTRKSSTRISTFYSKTGEKDLKLTQTEIREKAKEVIGQYGYGEDVYRSSLISRAFTTIKEWNIKHDEILKNLSYDQ